MMQIVNTLISKKEYADKMLLYAENHNQVTYLFQFLEDLWTLSFANHFGFNF